MYYMIIEQIDRIKNKLAELRRKDKNLIVFGSQLHQYKIQPKKTEDELQEFELKYNIKLPNEYQEFLKLVGNGGAGPNLGLEPIQNGIYKNLDYESGLIDPSKEFRFTEAWNLDFEDNKKYYKEYLD